MVSFKSATTISVFSLTLPTVANSAACLTPKTTKVPMASSHNPNKENLAMFPIDLRLVTKIFSPRYKRKKKGIPTAKNNSRDINHTGEPDVLTIS